MNSPRANNYGKFVAICQSQTIDKEWMRDWPGEVDTQQAAQALRPLALEFRQVESLSDEEVLAVFFNDRALTLLKSLRNMYCFWVIAEEAAKYIDDYQYNISLEAVVAAMEAKPDIPTTIVV